MLRPEALGQVFHAIVINLESSKHGTKVARNRKNFVFQSWYMKHFVSKQLLHRTQQI